MLFIRQVKHIILESAHDIRELLCWICINYVYIINYLYINYFEIQKAL